MRILSEINPPLPSTSLMGTTLTEGEGVAAGLSLILAPKFEFWAWLSSTGGVADMTVGVAGITVGGAVCAAGDWRFSNSLLNVSCPISCIESPFEPKGKNTFFQCLQIKEALIGSE